jgi:hypothetical protein
LKLVYEPPAERLGSGEGPRKVDAVQQHVEIGRFG